MKKSPHPFLLALALTSIALGGTPVNATPLGESLDFALHLSRQTIKLSDPQQSFDTTVKQIGITSFNISDPGLQPGLFLGYAFVDIGNQALTAGMEPEGFYIGPALRSAVIDTRNFGLTVTGAYFYQRVRDSNAAQTATLEWFQPQLDLDAAWRITSRLSVLVGGQYGRVDADEKLSGNVNQSITLKRRSILGSRAGLELNLGGDGQMGFLLHQAIGDGVELYFQRQF